MHDNIPSSVVHGAIAPLHDLPTAILNTNNILRLSLPCQSDPYKTQARYFVLGYTVDSDNKKGLRICVNLFPVY